MNRRISRIQDRVWNRMTRFFELRFRALLRLVMLRWSVSRGSRHQDREQAIRGTQDHFIEERLEQNRAHDAANALERENQTLRDENAELEAQLKNLIHGQDFRSTKETVGESHHTFQTDLGSVRTHIRSLVRNSFRQQRGLRLPMFCELPTEALGGLITQISLICSPEFASAVHRQSLHVSVLDLLDAVIGHIVYVHVIANPLFGTAEEFQATMNSNITTRMSVVNSKANRSWQARCLQAYYSESEFRPFFASPDERDQIRQAQCEKVADHVLDTIQGLYTFYEKRLPPRRKVMVMVLKCAGLASKLGQLESALDVMDLAWFSKQDGGYHEEWMELKSGSDDDHDGLNPPPRKLAVVLYPGLLKRGRDNGDNWDTWSVWNKAKVEMVDGELFMPAATIGDRRPSSETPMRALEPLTAGQRRPAAQEPSCDDVGNDRAALPNRKPRGRAASPPDRVAK